ncbi:MAG: permease-like cell division protein FtsX [Gammaproteobacteria bacterium]|nr:permease-like cell division protein FtsX [Gammaproteobacteria bacterium]
MLARLRVIVARHMQAAAYSFLVLRQQLFSTLMTTLVIAVALTLPTLFGIMGDNLKLMSHGWKENNHISLYLKMKAGPTEVAQTLKAVQAILGVERVALQTPEQGLKELEKQDGMQDVMQYLPENPLPAMIDVVPNASYDTPQKLQQLESRLKMLPFVEQVKLDMEWIQRLYTLLLLVKTMIQGITVLLAAAVILIIGNTLRLSFLHRQEELLVLKLVGATDAYIMRPFLYLGMWYGVLGALVAILFVTFFLFHISHAAQLVVSTYQLGLSFIGLTIKQSYCLVLFSGMLGWVASQCFVRTKLASIEVMK